MSMRRGALAKVAIAVTLGILAFAIVHILAYIIVDANTFDNTGYTRSVSALIGLVNAHFLDYYPLGTSAGITANYVTEMPLHRGILLLLTPPITMLFFGSIAARALSTSSDSVEQWAKHGASITPSYAIVAIFIAYTENHYEQRLGAPHPETGDIVISPEFQMPYVIFIMLIYPTIMGALGGYASWRFFDDGNADYDSSGDHNSSTESVEDTPPVRRELTEEEQRRERIAKYIWIAIFGIPVLIFTALYLRSLL